MLSIANLGSSSAASSYYEQDDYYAKDSPEHKELSQWFGKGAEKLRLEGNVEKADFEELLDGNLPNGEVLGRKEAKGNVHAAGIDLTFSAPKSVSIMAEVYGAKKIIEAHNKSVQKALEYVQDNLVSTRSQYNGKLVYEKVNNITVALFRHSTSRNLDPQLHTHCVLINAVERNDRSWRSAYFGEVFEHKMMLGQMYRLNLAHSLKEMGYEIKVTSNDSRFELACVPEELIKDFSKRANEIKAALGEQAETASAQLKAKVTIATRTGKEEVGREELEQLWQAAASQYTISNSSVHEANKERTFISKIISFFKGYEKEIEHYLLDNKKGNVEKQAVEYAIAHCSERSSQWSKSDILKVAMGYSSCLTTTDKLFKEFDQNVKENRLIKTYNRIEDKFYYSTKEALALEVITIKLMKQGQGAVKPILESSDIVKNIIQTDLNAGQRDAVTLILGSSDRIIGVQGYAGTGKTHMLRVARQAFDKAEYNAIGLAPSASAARTLQNESDITSITLQRFLAKYDGVVNDRATDLRLYTMKKEFSKTVVILDESSLASTKQINSLFVLAEKLDFKVVMLGDSKQLKGVGAGAPFEQLQRHGLKTALMGKIIRQRNKQLKSSVYKAINKNVRSAFMKLGDNILCSKALNDNRALATIAAKKWISLSHAERDETLIISPLNDIRIAINKEVRKSLISEETIANTPYKHEILNSLQLTNSEKRNPLAYEEGKVVVFSKAIPSLKIPKDVLFLVKSVSTYGVVTLSREGGRVVKLQPTKISDSRAQSIELYERKTLEIGVGETIKFTKNSKELNWVLNSETAKIVGINNQELTFTIQDGTTKSVPVNHPSLRHLDYGYCSTVHSSQGKTKDRVIGVIESDHKQLSTLPLFYVSISRAREAAILVTDDKDKLAKTLAKQTGESISVIEGKLAFDKLEKKATKDTLNTLNQYKKITTSELYTKLYDRLPSALPEFGFKKSGNCYVSTTDVKTDGSTGKKGKVYVYPNNPGQLIDYTRQSISIWDYVAQRHINSTSKETVMKYLSELAGIGENISPNKVHLTTKPLEQEVKQPLNHKINSDISNYAKEKLFESQNNQVLKYLKNERKYDTNLIEKMTIGYIDSHKNLNAYLTKCGHEENGIDQALKTLNCIGKTHKLVIPFEDKEGKVIGFVARDTSHSEDSKLGKYMYSKGLNKSDQLFNLTNVKGSELWVVEGIFDCLHARARGLDNIIALGGTSFNERQLKLLEDKGIAKLNICMDRDQAGRDATIKIIDSVSKSSSHIELRTIPLPTKVKDPDEALRSMGIEEFKKLGAIIKSQKGNSTIMGKTISNIEAHPVLMKDNDSFNSRINSKEKEFENI